MHAKRGGSDAEVPSDLREKVVRGLLAAIPDLELLDRDLDLGDERRVDLLGVEAGRRLCLVVIVPGEGDEPLLAAAAAVAFGRTHAVVLAEHLHRAAEARAQPRVIMVAEHFAPAVLERAPAMDPRLVSWMELRSISTSAGERHYLVRVAGEEPPGEDAPRERGFLQSIDPKHRQLARAALRRLSRLDHELEVREGESMVSFSLGKELLCSLMASRGEILGRVGREEAPREVGDLAALDALLEAVLEHHVSLLVDPGDAPAASLPASTERLAGGGPPFLTREEIEAFQDPH